MDNKSEAIHDDDCGQCTHHWLIDERNLGSCKKCGESKQFSGSWSALSLQKSWCSRAGKAQPNVQGTKS